MFNVVRCGSHHAYRVHIILLFVRKVLVFIVHKHIEWMHCIYVYGNNICECMVNSRYCISALVNIFKGKYEQENVCIGMLCLYVCNINRQKSIAYDNRNPKAWHHDICKKFSKNKYIFLSVCAGNARQGLHFKFVKTEIWRPKKSNIVFGQY